MATQAAAPAAVSTGDHDRLIEVSLVKWHFLTGFAFLLIAMLAGLLFSMQFLQQYPFKGIEIFSPGRWRFVHTQGVAYGFIANIFLGMLYWAVPRLTHRPVLSRPLSWFLFFAWQAVIVATGSEVQLALHAQALLAGSGIAVRVVSMPSTTVFDRQDPKYKTSVLPRALPRIAVEAGVTDGWWKYGCAAVIGRASCRERVYGLV